MAKSTKKTTVKRPPLHPDAKASLLLSLAVLGFCSLWSFRFLEPEQNWLGHLGYITALGAEYAFGLAAYLIPAYLFWLGARLLREKKTAISRIRPSVFSRTFSLQLYLIECVCRELSRARRSFPRENHQ